MAKRRLSSVPIVGAENYLAAARDVAAALGSLYEDRHYALLIYSSGLAVECLFRAFRAKKGLPFVSEHKLQNLAKEAGFSSVLSEAKEATYDAALATLIVAWDNAHRFKSNEEMRLFLKSIKLDRGVSGSYLKENARRISSAAVELITLGVEQWQP